MSLFSFLLGPDEEKGRAIDDGLDKIFHSTAAPSTVAQGNTFSAGTKEAPPSTREGKRRLSVSSPDSKSKKAKSGKEKETAHTLASKTSNGMGTSSQRKPPPQSSVGDSESQSDEDVSEDHATSTGRRKSNVTPSKGLRDAEEDASESDGEGDPSQLVHESLAKGAKSRSGDRTTKARYVPSDETSERRNARTIFVGNVPVEVVKSRPLQKQLRRHVLSFVLTAKIESIRFRSVAFQNPTSKLPTLENGVDASKGKQTQAGKEKDGRQHDRDRAASWRATKGQDEEDPVPAKVFLSPKEKKRIAFIKHELHSGVDAVNAYIVFAHPQPAAASRPANVPPPAPVMDPYEAAKAAAHSCDGSIFMERTLRVDTITKAAETEGAETSAGWTDPKATVFVGNLDFASKEEDLRVFFEGLVTAEKGPPTDKDGDSSDEDDEDEEEGDSTQKLAVNAKKPRTWVKRVRIVRDKDTQLGKGFAYVQFVDRECVDEILALEQDRLKFAKRKLRVQRCKTVPGSAKVTPKFARPPPSAVASRSPAAKWPRSASTSAGPPPKGDPSLGQKISHLPKEERKKVKASDADRVARRMAKKKGKILAEKGVRAKTDRERTRKRPGDKKAGSHKEKKGRVRSGKALSRMNVKK